MQVRNDLGVDGPCDRVRSTASGFRLKKPKKLLDAMPVAYAVTLHLRHDRSAIILALVGPRCLGIDLEAACKRYEEKHGGQEGIRRSRHSLAPIEGCVRSASRSGGRLSVDGCKKPRASSRERVFLQRIRRGEEIIEATGDIVIQAGTS